jgi:peptidoglycan/xylan/chitin deacetylase (PgdA/CDA1 family)
MLGVAVHRLARMRALVAPLLLCAQAVGAPMLGGCSAADAGERTIEAAHPQSAIALRWGAAECAPQTESGRGIVRCVTHGKGEPVFVASARPLPVPLDLERRFIRVWIKVADVSKLSGMELRLSSDGFDTSFFAIRVPLYEDPEFNVIKSGEWTPYTLSFASARVHGTPDRREINAIGWYVQDTGQGPLTVAWSSHAAVAADGPGVVSFTFDDGTLDHLTLCAPELARAGYRGTAYVIPDMVGHTGFLSLDDLATLRDRYAWEVAAHHTLPLTDLAPEQLEPLVLDIRRYLGDHGFGEHAGHFAFPLGKHRPGPVMEIARRHFATARIAGAGPETLPPADLHALRVYNIVRATEPGAVAEAARLAVANGDWLILMLHRVREPQQSELDYAPRKLREILDLLKAASLPVQPLGEVFETRVAPASARPPERATAR